MFFDVGIRAWKTYQIGEGHFYPYSSLTTNAQGGIAVKVLVPFSLSSNCSELQWLNIPPFRPACSLVRTKHELRCFLSTKNLIQHHLDAERHLFVEEQDTVNDVIKKKWTSILSNVSLQKQHPFPPMKAGCEGVLDYQEAVEGWALKTV